MTHAPNNDLIVVAYVIVTCGPALLSSRRYLRWFGLANLAGLSLAAIVRADELTSVWCVYAALASLLILEHFRRERVVDRRDSHPIPA